MKPSDQRLDERFATLLRVEVRWGREVRTLPTEDVSARGLFLCAHEAPPLRHLVRLAIELPNGDDHPLVIHGLVAHIVVPEPGSWRTPGFGIQFYAVDPDAQRVWAGHVASIASVAARLHRASLAPRSRAPEAYAAAR